MLFLVHFADLSINLRGDDLVPPRACVGVIGQKIKTFYFLYLLKNRSHIQILYPVFPADIPCGSVQSSDGHEDLRPKW